MSVKVFIWDGCLGIDSVISNMSMNHDPLAGIGRREVYCNRLVVNKSPPQTLPSQCLLGVTRYQSYISSWPIKTLLTSRGCTGHPISYNVLNKEQMLFHLSDFMSQMIDDLCPRDIWAWGLCILIIYHYIKQTSFMWSVHRSPYIPKKNNSKYRTVLN